MVSTGMEQKLMPQPINTKSNTQLNTSGSRQARTANTYGGTSVGGGNRPGTAVKSTISSNNGAIIRKPLQQQQQQMINDDRMFFGRPTTIGSGQYHNRTGLMPNKQDVASITSSSGQQRRPISWFQ